MKPVGLAPFAALLSIAVGSPCLLREYGPQKLVCVCNEEHCDSLDPIPKSIAKGSVKIYESSQAGLRLSAKDLKFQNTVEDAAIRVDVDATDHYQEILGFGGSFTDSSGINARLLSPKLQEDIMEAYYGKSGLEYTLGRVPMASCDFSTHAYSYCDYPGDFALKNFSLTEEDLLLKIPFVQRADQLTKARGQKLFMFASPWSSPAWMKTNNKMNESGVLRGEVGGQYYQTWADYFVRFLQEYEKYNISFWGLTAENEPDNGFVTDFEFQCLGFTAETQRDFIKLNLGPTLRKAGFGVDKVQLMILDDQRYHLPQWPVTVLSDPDAAQYVTGIAFHWYGNALAPVRNLDETHKQLPDYFLLATEACEGSMPWAKGVDLGSWARAESYAYDIIEDLLHWSVGWVDWNLALDLEGGPNWVENFVDAPIVVDSTRKEFYKQPMYYALAHFSKFIPPGSKRIGLTTTPAKTSLNIAAFLTPSGSTVVVVLNRKKNAATINFNDKRTGVFQNLVPGRSIQTYIW